MWYCRAFHAPHRDLQGCEGHEPDPALHQASSHKCLQPYTISLALRELFHSQAVSPWPHVPAGGMEATSVTGIVG